MKNFWEELLKDDGELSSLETNYEAMIPVLGHLNQDYNFFYQTEKNDNNKKGTKPGAPGMEIEDINEKAYQRAIFNYPEPTTLRLNDLKNNEEIIITWKDYEIPVEFGKNPRRSSIDLIGITSKPYLFKNRIVVAELKVKHSSGFPLYGLLEGLRYALKIKMNINELALREAHHKLINGNPIGNYWEEMKKCEGFPIVILAAPEKYWNFKYKPFLNDIDILLNKINAVFDTPLVFQAQFPDEDFKNQKNQSESYIPELCKGNNIWEKFTCK